MTARPSTRQRRPALTYDQHVRGQQWTQEINLLSPQGGRYDWVAGGYFARNHINVNIYETGTLGPQRPDRSTSTVRRRKPRRAGSASSTSNWRHGGSCRPGVRYSTYSATSNGFISLELPGGACANAALPPAPWNGCKVGSTAGAESDGRVTGKVALDYTLNDDNLLYAFIARGYKPGGFNSPTSPFGPETVWDYELGWKSVVAGEPLRTQLGGFYYQYQNFQFQELQLSTGTVGVTNLPTATIDGIEGSLQARVARVGRRRRCRLRALEAAEPAAVSSTITCCRRAPATCRNVRRAWRPSASCFDYTPYLTTTASGPNLYAPQWTYNFGLQYELRLGGGASLTPRLNYAYVGGQFTSLTYSRVTDYLPAHGLLAALLTLNVPALDCEVYGSNLTNSSTAAVKASTAAITTFTARRVNVGACYL